MVGTLEGYRHKFSPVSSNSKVLTHHNIIDETTLYLVLDVPQIP